MITQKFAKCSIISVEDTLLLNEFNSTLRKEDVREKEKDKVMKISINHYKYLI